MVTCARLAPACINLSPMAPPINTDLTTTTTTTSITSTKTTITTTTTVPTRPKLAFSIDALVGDNNEKKGEITQQCSFSISTAVSPIQHSESTTNNNNEPLCDVVGNSPTPSSECCPSCSSIDIQDTTSPDKPSTLISQVPHNLPKCPIRPLPMQLMTNALPQNMPPNFAHSMAPASSTETTMSTGVAPPHPAQPHFLTAQFQMAAALAHQHQQQQQHQQHLSNIHLPPGHPMTLFPHMSGNPHSHMLSAPPFIRDSYPLYPWFLNRHGRIFPHRFPGNFLLQPFRKPKRVRTAFSPTQLLKLEHAFEGNHYVVGAERKQLAQGLSLTETQVKVWFQNRRTKHKRMQQEGGDSDTKSNKDSQSDDIDAKNNDNGSENSFEDYDNVMTVDDDDDEVDENDNDNAVGQHVGEFGGHDVMIDMPMNDYGRDVDAVEQKKLHEQFQEQIKQHQQILLRQQYMHQHKDNSQPQFLNHQMHLPQQQQKQHQPEQLSHKPQT